MPEITLPYNFTPRKYQLNLMGAVPGKYSRGVFIWHRRAGKDKCGWNKIVTEAFKKKAVYYYLFPTYSQGRKVIWDGIDSKTGLKFIDHIPLECIANKHSTEMKLTLSNGSIIQVVGTDNIDAIMGTPPYGCVFSEYALQDPKAWDYIRPILRENGGWAIFNYTPRGKNHGWELFELAKGEKDWYVEKLTIRDTKREDGSRVISEESVQKDLAEGMSEELIQQEYYCSFEGLVVGSYYWKQLKRASEERRVGQVPHVTGHEVYTAWDLGMDDSTTIWFYQIINSQHRFIDYYENHGEGLHHYAKVLRDKPYVYGDYYLPHDVEVRELGTGKSRKEVLHNLGLKSIITVKRAKDQQAVLNGIEAVRNILSQCWFDENNCKRGLMALQNYHAEYDDYKKKLGNHPYHDWSSHGADAFRTFAAGHKTKMHTKSVTEMIYGR